MRRVNEDLPDTDGVAAPTMDCPRHGNQIVSRAGDPCPACEDSRRLYLQRLEGRLLKLGLPEQFQGVSLADFTVGGPQQEAAREAFQAVLRLERTMGFMALGKVGTGKTLLGCGLVHDWERTRWDRGDRGPAAFTTAPRLLRTIKDTFGSGGSEQEVVDQWTRPGLLVLDELGAGKGSDWEVATLSEILVERHNHSRPSVVISNLGLSAVRQVLDERAVGRFREDGGAIPFNWWAPRQGPEGDGR